MSGFPHLARISKILWAAGVRKPQFVTHNHIASRIFAQNQGRLGSQPFGASNRFARLGFRLRMTSA
jgi:hypothetical protein